MGDYVTFQYNPNGQSMIESVCERKSVLKRPDQSGHAINYVKTSEIREEDGKGRHTTTYRALIELENGVTLIDTPGMRELGMCDVEEGIDETFSDIVDKENLGIKFSHLAIGPCSINC